MRIAFVTPYLPSPANTGGRIRMHRLARALAAHGATLGLYACAGVREAREQRTREELGLYAAALRVRESDVGAVPPWTRPPARVRKACPVRLAWDLARDHARAPYDAVVVCHSYATATTALLPPVVPRVLDEHNVESAYLAAYAASETRPRDTRRAGREVARLAAWERRAWAEARLVSCVSEADAARVRAAQRAVRVVPNGADVRAIDFAPPSARAGRTDVLFVGLMAHAPNVAAARFLAEHVMPRVWHEVPAARLVLCGRAPSREVRALAGPRVEVTGTVPAVAPYLARAGVYANALFHGAGSSLKVPEALAAGVPMVSSATGVRGFPLAPREHFAPAEDAAAFARELVNVLRADGARRAALDAQAARARAVAERYDWEAVGARFARLVERAARRADLVADEAGA